MRDEARNTASHQSNWGQDARLRQKPVAFVSAGFIEPLKDPMPADESDPMTPEGRAGEGNTNPAESSLGQTSQILSTQSIGHVEVNNEHGKSTPVLEITAEKASIDESIDANSSSSNMLLQNPAVFFFDLKGDESLRQDFLPVNIPTRASSPTRSDSSEEVILFKGRAAHAQRSAPLDRMGADNATRPSPNDESLRETVQGTSQNVDSGEATESVGVLEVCAEQHNAAMLILSEGEEEDAIMADYIANMAAQSEDDTMTDLLKTFNTGRDLGGEHHAFDLGMEDEVEGKIVGGPDGAPRLDNDIDQDDADTSDTGMASDVDDESLARILSKQEELGMGSDEILLRSESFVGPESRSRNRHPSSHLTTDAVADDFHNLDITEWEQPNLRRSGRARHTKQPPTFNVSDSEIELALRTAWQTDRERKKKRKLEREILRREGLLGKNVNPDDLRVKYQSHMTLDEVKSEMATFLLGTEET